MSRCSLAQIKCDAVPLFRRSRYSDIGVAKPRHRRRSAGSGEELPVPLAPPALDQAMRSREPLPGSADAYSALLRRPDQKREPTATGWRKKVFGANRATDRRQV